MLKIYKNLNLSKIHKKSILLIGNFDGLHLGHQKLFKLAKKYYETEASGNIDLKSIKKVAATGGDRISIGSITHSVSAVDLKLEI